MIARSPRLAISRAITLNHANRFVRSALPDGGLRPRFVDTQAVVALLPMVCLWWANRCQFGHQLTTSVRWRYAGGGCRLIWGPGRKKIWIIGLFFGCEVAPDGVAG